MIASALAWQPAPAALASKSDRSWTIDDIVAVPEVGDLALSSDAGFAAYIVRTANVIADRPEYELHIVRLADRHDEIVARSKLLDRLTAIPGRSTWSVLGDFGRGVQLYEITNDGERTPIVETAATVLVGSADGANYGYWEAPPTRVGVAFYDWSPGGTRLFYSTLEQQPPLHEPLVGEDVTTASSRRRWAPNVQVRFFMRSGLGDDKLMFTRPASDRVARYLGALPVWGGDHLDYALQADNNPDPAIHRFRWEFRSARSAPLSENAPEKARDTVRGPRGGVLAVSRIGTERHLIERLRDGGTEDYGATRAQLSDGRSPGHWWSPAHGFALVAIRLVDEARYALLRIDRSGHSRLIQTRESLTHCAFTPDVLHGVCIHEGLMQAPELVRVATLSGHITSVQPLSAHYAGLKPFDYTALTWVNRFGFRTRGFIIYPRGYRQGGRYPAIIVTHGSDADERFAAPDLQWNYPVQLFAERGYVVLLVNDPDRAQSEILERAAQTWNSCDGRVRPAEVQRLIWLNAVESYRSLVGDLVGQGVIDPARIGIAGYSGGSQMVNVAVTQSDLFKAASSGDGAYLEPAAYRYSRCGYDAIYGGPPSDPAAFPNYLALAPSYRAKFAKAAVLQQLAEPRAGAVDFFQALRAAGAPAEITLYPGETPATDETHLFHIPSNRRAAMLENIEWFDFWLRRETPSSAEEKNRFARWATMRTRTDKTTSQR